MLNRGLEINIVLPFAADEFRRTSVALEGIDETQEFWDVLKHASSVSIATDESHLNNPCLYNHAADLIEGHAQLRARQCDGQAKFIAAIDPYTSGELGGSIERAIIWLEEGLDVHIIDLSKIRGAEKTVSILPKPNQKADTRRLDREIKTIVEVSSNTNDDAVHRVMADNSTVCTGPSCRSRHRSTENSRIHA